MSKTGKNKVEWCDLDAPSIRILMFGYSRNIQPEIWYHPNRISPFWRFYWGASDGANLIFRENAVKLNRQSVVFVPPNTPFETRADNPFSQFYIHFSWFGPTSPLKPVIMPADEEKTLLSSVQNWDESSAQTVSLHVHAVLFHYLIKLQPHLPEPASAVDLRIQKAVLMMEEKNTRLSLKEIAKAVSMSYDHFRDTFKKEIGLGPGEYKMMRRMSYARDLLLSSGFPIEEIAYKTGFSNRFHFSKTFKKFFKLPPVVYRKTRLNG